MLLLTLFFSQRYFLEKGENYKEQSFWKLKHDTTFEKQLSETAPWTWSWCWNQLRPSSTHARPEWFWGRLVVKVKIPNPMIKNCFKSRLAYFLNIDFLQVAPNTSIPFSLQIVPVQAGFISISGIRLYDSFLKRTYENDDVAQLFVSWKQGCKFGYRWRSSSFGGSKIFVIINFYTHFSQASFSKSIRKK